MKFIYEQIQIQRPVYADLKVGDTFCVPGVQGVFMKSVYADFCLNTGCQSTRCQPSQGIRPVTCEVKVVA